MNLAVQREEIEGSSPSVSNQLRTSHQQQKLLYR